MVAFSGQTPFVGREQELRLLDAAYAATQAGQGTLVLLAGEPGIGKTALARALTTHVAQHGGRVLWGRCWEGDGAPAYLPWREALGASVRRLEPAALQAQLGAAAPDIGQLVPEVRALLPDLPAPSPADPEEARYRLFSAVAAFVEQIAAAQPLALVLDDLHWADTSSLRLLQFLVPRLREAPVLVVATYRDTDLDRRHPLADALPALRREPGVERIALRGLTADDVVTLLTARAGQDLDAAGRALAQALHTETEGNPLFLGETLRHLVESGRIVQQDGRWTATAPITDMGIPEGVKEVIGRRLSRLPAETNRVLQSAAVLGREFGFAVLAAMTGLDEEAVLDAVDEALLGRVIEEGRGQAAATYSFSHALVQLTLLEELNLPRRQRLHLRAADAIERVHARNLGPHVAVLAMHLELAGTAADQTKARDYAREAALAAEAVYAWEDAIRHWEAALDAQERLDPSDVAGRIDLLLALCDALIAAGEPKRVLNDFGVAARTFIESTRDAGRATRLAALVIGALFGHAGGASPAQADMARWAAVLDGLAEPDSLGRVYADFLLGQQALGQDQWDEAWRRIHACLDLAQRLGDRRSVVLALNFIAGWPWAPQHQAARLRATEELLAHLRAEPAWTHDMTFLGTATSVLLQFGMPDEAVRWHEQVAESARRTHRSGAILRAAVNDGLLLVIRGQLEDAVVWGDHYLDLCRQLGAEMLGRRLIVWLTLWPLLMLGRGEETPVPPPDLRGPNAVAADIDPWAERRTLCELAYWLAHVGRHREARQVVRRIAAQYALTDPHDDTGIARLLMVQEAATLVGDHEVAASITPRLAMVSHVASMQSGPMTTVARVLGGAAALLGDHEQARAWYRQALEVAGRIGFRPDAALTHLELGQLLVVGNAGERRIAMEHLDVAIAELQTMKMAPALERALALRAGPVGKTGESAPAPAHPDGLTEREVEVLRLVAAGHTNQEIADTLVLSVRTVERHTVNLYTKIGARGRPDAIVYALRHGLTTAG